MWPEGCGFEGVVTLLSVSREFGASVVNLKMLMKAVPALFLHSDKNVRAEVSKGSPAVRLTPYEPD